MDKKLKTEIDDVEIMIGKVMQIGVVLSALVIILIWDAGTEAVCGFDDGHLLADPDTGVASGRFDLRFCS